MARLAAVVVMAVTVFLAGCFPGPTCDGTNCGPKPPNPAVQAAAIGVVVAAQAYRDRVQSELTRTRDSQKIAEKQALITSLDTIKMRMANFNQVMSLGEKLQIASSVSDIVKTRFPDRADMINSANLLVQVLMTAVNAANVAAQQEAAQQGN